jgi:hypothetical protein
MNEKTYISQKLAQSSVPGCERERERVNNPSRKISFSLKTVAVLFCFALFFGLASSASAATYYVRADGTVTAANKANATSPNAVGTSLNMAQANASTFLAGDQVLFSSQGGNYTSSLVLPSGGSGVDTEITYANVPAETPVISMATDPLIDTNAKSNIKIIGFSLIYTGTTNNFANGIKVNGNGTSNITINSNTINMGGYGYGIISASNNLSGVHMDGNSISNAGATKFSLYFYGTGLSNFTLTNHTVVETSLGAHLLNINGLTVNGYNASGGVASTNMIKVSSCTGTISINNLTANITLGTALYLYQCTFGSGSAVSNANISNSTAGNAITIDSSTGTFAMSSGITVTGTNGNYSIAYVSSALTNATLSANISGTAKPGFRFDNSSGLTVSSSSYSGTGTSGYFVANGSHNIDFISNTSNGGGLGGGFWEQDSSYITYTGKWIWLYSKNDNR